MTPRERFLAALYGKPVDRPSVAHIAALTNLELQNATGCRMPEVHHDAGKLVKLMAANHEVLGFDAVTFIINFFNEPAALGVEMDWGAPDRLPAYKSHPWKTVEDAVVPDGLLQRPPVSTYLEALELAHRDWGGRIGVLGKVMGPLSMVQVMHGLDTTMTELMTAPERVTRFLSVAADILVICANAQFEKGIDALAIGEGGAGARMLSPGMYAEILAPVHKAMIERINRPVIMHICGDITPRLHLLAETGLTCFNFDRAIAPRAMVEAAEGRFTLMGNVDTGDLLNAEPGTIKRQVWECLDAGVHIIGPGCAVSPKCPSANFKAMVEAVWEWDGR